jgi:DNA-binding beta-propeller fold protein YncE
MKPCLKNCSRLAVLIAVTLVLSSSETRLAFGAESTPSPGRAEAGRYWTPANQILTPAGIQVELPGLRPQALALSPNGKILVSAGKTHELIVIDPRSGKIQQRVPLPSSESEPTPNPVSEGILAPDKEGQLSYTGLAFSPDGSRIYLANVNGSIKVFGVGADGRVEGLFSLPLPTAGIGRRKGEIPAGIAVSADGKRLYVALNLSNQLAELDAVDGHLLRLWETGFAPYDVVLAGNKAYVSNWGGRRPDTNSMTGPAGHGTRVRVDPVRHIANEGSVSVMDLLAGENPNQKSKSQNPKSEVLTGARASALAVSPNHRWLVVANSGSDTITVIDTHSDEIVEAICARQSPADLFGAQPNAMAFDKTGRKLFVCNGTQNAVAVFDFQPGRSQLLGLIPVGWFPGAIAYDARRRALYVANIKGIGSTRKLGPRDPIKYNSHEFFGTLSLVGEPSSHGLKTMTQTALAGLRYPQLQAAKLPRRDGEPPRPVPERVGEPCVFKHVVYIIKENRTYDQVLGDMREGNGDELLCIFPEKITPNQHKLAREFVLLDNTFCSGVLSADGHQWTDSAITTDYLERSFAGFPRSYPDGMGDSEVDALAYSPAGFIWDNAIAHGKSLRDYGEFAITESRWRNGAKRGEPTFTDYYRDFIDHADQIEIWSRPSIESLRPYLCTNTVGWDLSIPDAFRADQFIKELRQFEAAGAGFPNLVIICLPNDHTSGTKAGAPKPEAMVADNDLAFARIVEAISHSRFWPETCIFAIEDDPQNGWDHVSAYRTTAYVISPYTRRHAVVSVPYNHTSVVRTIELMLGLPPMNQLDATATPMSDCFTNNAELSPFTGAPNEVPLDRMNPDPKKISDPLLRKDARLSARLPLKEPDQCPEDELNRILWHAMKGSSATYPAWASHGAGDRD